MNIRQLTASSVFWTTVESGASKLISLAVFLAMARLLGPEEFGLIALAATAVSFSEFFIRIGFSEAIVQREKLDNEHLDTAFWTMTCIGVALTIVSILLAGPISRWFDNSDLAPVLRWLSMSILILSLTRVQAAILRRQFKFRALALRTLIATLAGGVAGLYMALTGWGVWALVTQQLVDATVSLLVLWASSHWRPGLKFSVEHFRDLFGFGINIMGAQLMHFINRHTPRLVIGSFLGIVLVGYYAVANRLILIVKQMIEKTFTNVLFSSFSRMQSDVDRLRAAFNKCMRQVALVSFPIFTFLAFASQEIISVVFGDKWISSANVLCYLAIASIFEAFTILYNLVFNAVGRPDLSMRASLVKTTLEVILILLFVSYGLEAVAMAVLARSALLLPYRFYLINRIFNLEMRWVLVQFRAPLVGSALLVLALQSLRYFSGGLVDGLVELLLMMTISCLVYFSTLWLVDRPLLLESFESARLVLARGKKS